MDISSIFHIYGMSKSKFVKFQYLACQPLALITAEQRRLILLMSRRMTRKGVCAHSSCKAQLWSLRC